VVKGEVERYGIYLADLDPARPGAKTRPVVIISQEAMNRNLDTVVVCPLQGSSQWRSRIQITCARKKAEIAVDQIRTISKERLGKRIDRLEASTTAQLRHLITEMYGQ
jgi:mRNA interferase MazF